MRRDFVKAALAFLTIIICLVTVLIYGNNYGENIMAKPAFTDNINDSYNRLKQDLKDKYAELIYKIVDKIKSEITFSALEIFGESTMQKFDEAEALKAEIDNIKRDFYGEDRYKTLQEELAFLKNQLAEAKEEQAKEITSKIQAAMAKITTLNITLKNRIKDKTERLDKLNEFIEGEFNKNKSAFDKVKDELFEKIKEEVADCLDEYNDELTLLNETFGKETSDAEMPFDENELRVDLPIFSRKYAVGSSDTYIPSDNDNPLKN